MALPVALPPLVGVIAFLFLYGESGFVSRAVQALLGLEQPPWRLAGPGAILLVHAYSMYVYFYLFTRAGLARHRLQLLDVRPEILLHFPRSGTLHVEDQLRAPVDRLDVEFETARPAGFHQFCPHLLR